MTTQNALTMRAIMRTHDGEVLRPTDPVMRYEVLDDRGEKVAYITNTRAHGRPASWGISLIIAGRVGMGEGDYATAEDALSTLGGGSQ